MKRHEIEKKKKGRVASGRDATYHHDGDSSSDVPHHIDWGLFFGGVDGHASRDVHGARPGQSRRRVPAVDHVRFGLLLLAVNHGDPETQPLSIRCRLVGRSGVASDDNRVAIIRDLRGTHR